MSILQNQNENITTFTLVSKNKTFVHINDIFVWILKYLSNQQDKMKVTSSWTVQQKDLATMQVGMNLHTKRKGVSLLYHINKLEGQQRTFETTFSTFLQKKKKNFCKKEKKKRRRTQIWSCLQFYKYTTFELSYTMANNYERF